MNKQPDFLSKDMHSMTSAEWESICDGCGLCCQVRYQDEDTDEIVLSNEACKFLCLNSHRCSDYANRLKNQPNCAKITPDNIHGLDWLPSTCGYRLVAFGHDLQDWHPLISGDPMSVHTHEDSPSMKGYLIHEDEEDDDEQETM
jgi:uncharacterized cysteine cluster protein YcgN (CxxCxxCC family)